MRKWKKTSIMCAAALAASLTLGGCGGSSSNTSASGDTKAKGGDEPVALSFSWWGNDDRHQATQKAIDAFNAAHEGKIVVTGELPDSVT